MHAAGPTVSAEHRSRRIRARSAVHATTGMGRRAGQVEPVDRGLGPPHPGHGPEHQLLVDGRRTRAERADDVVVDLKGFEVGDSIHISAVTLPKGAKAAIEDRDFTIATIVAPSALKSAEGEAAEGEGE